MSFQETKLSQAKSHERFASTQTTSSGFTISKNDSTIRWRIYAELKGKDKYLRCEFRRGWAEEDGRGFIDGEAPTMTEWSRRRCWIQRRTRAIEAYNEWFLRVGLPSVLPFTFSHKEAFIAGSDWTDTGIPKLLTMFTGDYPSSSVWIFYAIFLLLPYGFLRLFLLLQFLSWSDSGEMLIVDGEGVVNLLR